MTTMTTTRSTHVHDGGPCGCRRHVFRERRRGPCTAAGVACVGGAAGTAAARRSATASRRAEQFQPYPGGTGALMEKLVKERGAAAFERAPSRADDVDRRRADVRRGRSRSCPRIGCPRSSRSASITSTHLTTIYLDRLKRLNPTLLCAVTIMGDAGAGRGGARPMPRSRRASIAGRCTASRTASRICSRPRASARRGASRDFENRVIDEDAEVVVRLRDAGAVLIAKLVDRALRAERPVVRRPHEQPVGPRAGLERLVGRPGVGDGGGLRRVRHRHGDAGIDRVAGARCGFERAAADVRPREPPRRHGARVVAGSRRADLPHGRGLRDGVQRASTASTRRTRRRSRRRSAFDRNIKLASLRVGVDPDAPKELVDKLRELGLKPRDIGPRPTVPDSAAAASSVESAAAFDDYVRRKAKETGLDLTTCRRHSCRRHSPRRPTRWRRRTGTRGS